MIDEAHMRYLFFLDKDNLWTENLSGAPIWQFTIGFIRVGAISDPFSDPFPSNTLGWAIEFVKLEVPFFKNGSFPIGSTIE